MKLDLAARLFEIARKISDSTPEFQAVKGPGAGNQATNAFLKTIQSRATKEFGEDFSESRICGNTAQAVDFYFPSQRTIVEIALGLPNPATEFEKDVLKAVMAQEKGNDVRRLMFISRPGAIKKCNQPGRAAIVKWAKKHHDISIEIRELGGIPRKRNRKTRAKP